MRSGAGPSCVERCWFASSDLILLVAVVANFVERDTLVRKEDVRFLRERE